jgi:hypothetical protein
MFSFREIPDFMIDRAIDSLQKLKNDVNSELSYLRRQKATRESNRIHEKNLKKIARALAETGDVDDNQARHWLNAQGHNWNYAGEIIKAKKDHVKHQKKAATELEIFRRWIIVGDKKTDLALEFGVSRATVERICKKQAENDGLQRLVEIWRQAPKTKNLKKKKEPSLRPTPVSQVMQ